MPVLLLPKVMELYAEKVFLWHEMKTIMRLLRMVIQIVMINIRSLNNNSARTNFTKIFLKIYLVKFSINQIWFCL